MTIAENVLLRLSQCDHLIKTNIELEGYKIDLADDSEDTENPGFTKAWYHFLDMLSNSIISFPSTQAIENNNSFQIEVRITDEIIAIFKDSKLIEEFLVKSEKKSQFFSNMGISSSTTNIGKKLGL